MDLNCHIGRQRWIHPEKSMTEGFERVKIANLIKYNAEVHLVCAPPTKKMSGHRTGTEKGHE